MTVETSATSHSYLPGSAMLAEALTGIVYTEAAQITVTRVLADGTRTALDLGTHYALGGNGAIGAGTVTALVSEASDTTWLVERETPVLQRSRFPAQQPLRTADIEAALDRQAMVAQELQRDVGQALRVPSGEAAPVLPPAADRASKFLAFSALGEPIAAEGVGAPPTDAALIPWHGPGVGPLIRDRTVAERLNDHYPITDRARGDGTDQTAAIQAAILYAEANGLTITCPPGNFASRELFFTRPARIIGAGAFGWHLGMGTLFQLLPGTNADHFNIAYGSDWQAGANYRVPAFEIEGVALNGQWAYQTAGRGIHFVNGPSSWSPTQYGTSLIMRRCQVMEYAEACLRLGSNRNAAEVDTTIFRWSKTNVIEIAAASGDHRFHKCDIAGAQAGYSNVRGVSGAFGVDLDQCNIYSAAEHGVDWEANSAVLNITGGQINGNAKCAVVLRGNPGGDEYPVSITNVMMEGNSLAGDGLYSDILVIDRQNVRLSNSHYSPPGFNRVKYLIETRGEGRADGSGTRWKSGTYASGISNDPLSAGCETVSQLTSLAALPAGAARYIGPQGEYATVTQSPFVVGQTSQVVMGFRVATTTFPGAGKNYTFTLYKNGVATAMTGQISGAAANTLTVITNPITFALNDVFELRCDVDAGAAPPFLRGVIYVKNAP